jgi:hypothetical protein
VLWQQDAEFAASSGSYSGVNAIEILSGSSVLTGTVNMIVSGFNPSYANPNSLLGLCTVSYYVFGSNVSTTFTGHNVQSSFSYSNGSTTTVSPIITTFTNFTTYTTSFLAPAVASDLLTYHGVLITRSMIVPLDPGAFSTFCTLTVDNSSGFSAILVPVSCTISGQGGVPYSFVSPAQTITVLEPGV